MAIAHRLRVPHDLGTAVLYEVVFESFHSRTFIITDFTSTTFHQFLRLPGDVHLRFLSVNLFILLHVHSDPTLLV